MSARRAMRAPRPPQIGHDAAAHVLANQQRQVPQFPQDQCPGPGQVCPGFREPVQLPADGPHVFQIRLALGQQSRGH